MNTNCISFIVFVGGKGVTAVYHTFSSIRVIIVEITLPKLMTQQTIAMSLIILPFHITNFNMMEYGHFLLFGKELNPKSHRTSFYLAFLNNDLFSWRCGWVS